MELLLKRHLGVFSEARAEESVAFLAQRSRSGVSLGADAIARVPRPSTILLAVALLLIIISNPVSADILIDKQQAQIGDLVHIKIIPALQDQTLVIITPSTTYRFIGGMPDNAAFVPEETGEHIIRIIDQNTLVDTASFSVGGAAQERPAASELKVSAYETAVGEPIIIDAPVLNVQTIGVKGDGIDMRYVDSHRPVTYIPKSPGPLEVWLRYMNGTLESTTVQVRGDTDPYVSLPSNDPSPVLPTAPTAPLATMIETSTGVSVDADMVWRRQGTVVRQTTAALFSERELDPGMYDLDLRMRWKNLESIRFSNLTYRPGMRFGAEDVPNPKGAPLGTISAFAIDPSTLEFATAEVSFVAEGIALHKCVDYNFTTQTCYGENVKIMDLVPGQQYSFTIDSKDPLFSQTGYLANPSFDSDITGWTTLTETADVPTYSWIASDSGQSGVAQISYTGSNKNVIGNYYQTFNLTIPAGTTLAGINFSALWRISTYSRPGSVDLMIQDSARATTYCTTNVPFSGGTVWQTIRADTGAGGCNLTSFTPSTTYTFRLRCTLVTAPSGSSNEVCRWDDALITVWYNDTTAPSITNVADSPDPVTFGNTVMVTANVSDNIEVNTVLVEIAETNYTMSPAGGTGYSFNSFNTAQTPGVYNYRIYANDTNSNIAASSISNFTIIDVNAPYITLLNPTNNTFTNLASFIAQYNISDEVAISNCSINVSNTIANSTLNPPLATTLNLAAALPADSNYTWNIACNDTSNNRNTSETRAIVRDSTAPTVTLNLENGTATNNVTVLLSYTPIDIYLANCSLWGNFTGMWGINRTNTSVTSGIVNVFSQGLSHGHHLWNVQCYDLATNSAFANPNRTLVVDRIAPAYSSVSISPASSVIYATGASYRFNITYTDSMTNVSAVYLETNFSGVLANVTPSQNGNVYNYSFADRPAGTYTYRWYGIDAVGNVNMTAQAAYIIEKATPVLNLTLNSSYANMSVQLDDWVNSTGDAIIPSSGYLELYRDGIRINAGQGRLENITQLTVEKRYNFTILYNATQNYSATHLSLFADVVDLTPPTVALGDPLNNSIQNSIVTFFFTPQDNVEIGNCTIILDDNPNATKDVSRNTLENITINGIADGLHNWTVSCTDTSDNTGTNDTVKQFTTDTVTPSTFSLLNPASGSISSNLSPYFAWQQTSDTTFANYTLEIDNDVNFGSVNYRTNTSPITNTSFSFTLLDQTVWHWRVTAHDMAGNTRVSDQVFNYTADATAPSIALTTPANRSHYNVTQIKLNYTATDFTQIVNCSLYVNSALNQTDTGILPGANSFTLNVNEQSYTWHIICYDNASNSGSSTMWNFTIDRTPPSAFSITGPADNTISSDNTPTYLFTQTTDPHFSNYTIEVSDNESFPYINHTLWTALITNTSITQTPPLADGVWYWRVIAYDKAGNNRTVHPTYIVDTTPPTTFDLIAPASGTETRNTTPLFQWQQTSDSTFANYTLLISDRGDFSSINYTLTTSPVTNTSASMTLAQNTLFHWKVVAADLAGNTRNSTSTSTYMADFAIPVVQLVSPADASTITTSPLVPFRFNVSDPGTITECSLYINGTLEKTLNSPSKDMTQTINHNLLNGAYSWHVGCTDIAGNAANSTARLITLNVQTPTQKLYESSVGASTFTPPANINLSSNDGSESSSSITTGGGTITTMAFATYRSIGQGLLIYNGTVLNFSGVFDASTTGDFYITWKAHKANSSGSTLLCQAGNDNTGGVLIGSTSKTTYRSSCTANVGDVRLFSGDNLTLTVNLYKSGGTSRTATHYWEGTSDSSITFQGHALGTLLASFTNLTNPAPSETSSYVEQCNTTCVDGSCLNTEVLLQRWNGSTWLNLGTSGNITLNGSQVNPAAIGNINSTLIINFSLYGNLHSINNTLRCSATSTYSNATSSLKNVSIIDRLAPTVALNAPAEGAAFEPQNITFQYTPYDVRLASCTLWGNWSGTWQANQTQSPLNGSTNSFSPIWLDYGLYGWNVFCSDTVGNIGYASNRTLHIAGDVEITDDAILFSTIQPVEGQEITIFANISNNANRTENAVLVRFYLGNPDVGGVQIGSDRTVRLAPFSWNTTTVTWIVQIGTHDIYVIVDEENGIVESDELNNKASSSLYITMWQTYYGNVSGNVTLGTTANTTFLNWQFINQSGNLYITDSDTLNGISFSFLRAFGQNMTGEVNGQTLDDFDELDAVLGTTTYVDSINSSYTSEGIPSATRSFFVYGTTISGVPVIDSTADGNFTTGILWDSDDSSNAYYDGVDQEDVVFVTELQNSTLGIHGFVDYSIRIPSKLEDYRGSAGTVNFYYELY